MGKVMMAHANGDTVFSLLCLEHRMLVNIRMQGGKPAKRFNLSIADFIIGILGKLLIYIVGNELLLLMLEPRQII
jgi:hypothetical protein